MVYEKIMNVSKALGTLAGNVSEEQWAMIRMAKAELLDAADMARELESSMIVPGLDPDHARRQKLFRSELFQVGIPPDHARRQKFYQDEEAKDRLMEGS